MTKANSTKRKPGPKGFPDYWSWSAYDQWRKCPAKYYFNRVLKIRTPTGPAAERGLKIHKLSENVINGKITGIPDELRHFKDELKKVKGLGAFAEFDMTLTKDFEHTRGNDFDNAWCRGTADILLLDEDAKEVVIIDIKTGKIRNYDAQLELYAWMASKIWPWLETVYVGVWFVDHGEAHEKEFHINALTKSINEKWMDRAERMLADRTFRAKPSANECRYCYFRSDREGGKCHAWKRA